MNFSDFKIKFLDIRGGDIPDSEYFKIKAVSNSKLKLINPDEGGSPALYQQGFPPYTYNVSLALGTTIHTQLLQPEDFALSDYSNKPSGKCGYFIDCILKFRKKGLPLYQAIEKASEKADYYSGKLTPKILRKALENGLEYYLKSSHGDFTVEGKETIVLPKKQLETAKKCIKSINRNRDIQRIIQPSIFDESEKEFFNEMAVLTNIEVTFPDGEKRIIPFKGKLDSVVVDHVEKRVYLNDVKTTSRPIDAFMDRVIDGEAYCGAFSHHFYERQLAVYLICLQKYFREILNYQNYSYECNIFAVETTGSNSSKKFRINQAYIDKGIKEFKELICRVAYHERFGFDRQFE